MSVAVAVVSKKKTPSKNMPTHRLVLAQGKEKESRVYTNVAFLFSTVFGGNMKALGGAEILPQTEEGAPMQKNGLVKYFVSNNKDGSTVLLKRIKADEADEKGKFETLATLKTFTKDGKEGFSGQINDNDAFLVLPWAPRA